MKRLSSKVLLLGTLLLWEQILNGFCSEEVWRDAAAEALKGFSDDVGNKWTELTKRRIGNDPWGSASAASVLPKGYKLHCYVGLEYDHVNKTMMITRKLYANAQCSSAAFRVRADTFQLVFGWIARNHPELHFDHNFRFWADLVDGPAGPSDMYEKMSYPVLGAGHSPENNYVLPVPELYIILALVNSEPHLREQFFTLEDGPRHEGFIKSMTDTFSFNYNVVPWAERKNKAIFRASCIPTINPAPDRFPMPYYFLRGMLCQTVSKNTQGAHLYDVGTTAPSKYGCHKGDQADMFPHLCQLCSNCSGKPWVQKEEMMTYKYLLHVDGLGPTYDAIYWKLGSGSVVFPVWERENTPYYAQWFYPLLTPSVDYLPVTFKTLHERVQWCVENDGVCELIGRRGAKTMRKKVTVRTVYHYLAQTLQLIHDTQ